jgi:hypothetical protein
MTEEHAKRGLPRPRFTLRFLLVVITIAAVLFGIGRRMLMEHPVTVQETMGLKVGMSKLEVRWRLGAPHQIYDSSMPESWGFDYADSEGLPFHSFNVAFEDGRVEKVERMSNRSPSFSETF